MCGETGVVMVGGTAGQVMVMQLAEETKNDKMVVCKAEMVTEREGFVWKGHKPLTIKTKAISQPAGLQV